MSVCTRAVCPHEPPQGVFIWLGDGPEPDGTYPWVHDTSKSPGHLEVCELMPFATPEEAGEVPAAVEAKPLEASAPADSSLEQMTLFGDPAPPAVHGPKRGRREQTLTVLGDRL